MSSAAFDWHVVWVSAILPNLEALVAYFVVRAYLHRPHRPPPPDVILPEGWQRWHADGRGYLRFYTWRRGKWQELPERRIKAEEEPADS